MDLNQIVKPGTEIKFKKQFSVNYNGIVKAVWIGDGSVQYQISYFNQGIVQEPYVLREMFDVCGGCTSSAYRISDSSTS